MDLRSLLLSVQGGSGLASAMQTLLAQQKETWQLCSDGYRSLERVEVRTFQFDGFRILVQHNPGRIISSTAKVDAHSIQARPCFLCAQNLPQPQRGLLYETDFLILCNPFPILPHHFTIVHRDHRPQQIQGFLPPMLHLAKDLRGAFTVIYNGPRCGASAPDHLHFQAGDRDFMPVQSELARLAGLTDRLIIDSHRVRIFAGEDNLRPWILVVSPNEVAMIEWMENCIEAMREVFRTEEEPMMNLLCWYDDDGWRLVVFPRAVHRPSFYFGEGERKILISPAAVDLGGVCIVPRKEDFDKITADHLTEMFEEVMISREQFGHVKERIATFSRRGQDTH